MGLDMYLYKDYYIGGRYAKNKDELIEFTVKKGIESFRSFKLGDIDSIRCLAIQWRKAYAIDRWFGEHCGNEDCTYVGYDQIRDLYDTVCAVRSDHSKAQELLPNNGCYDGWYWEDLEFTYNELSRLIQEMNDEGYFCLYYERSC